MNLIFIYEDFKEFITLNYPDDLMQQELLERQLERDVFCAIQQITPRTERRRRDSAIRIRNLIDAGITFDQIVNIGISVTDFEADNIYYDKFLLALDLQYIKNLSGRTLLSLEPLSIEPVNPRTLLNNLAKSISNIQEIDIGLDDANEQHNNNMDVEN